MFEHRPKKSTNINSSIIFEDIEKNEKQKIEYLKDLVKKLKEYPKENSFFHFRQARVHYLLEFLGIQIDDYSDLHAYQKEDFFTPIAVELYVHYRSILVTCENSTVAANLKKAIIGILDLKNYRFTEHGVGWNGKEWNTVFTVCNEDHCRRLCHTGSWVYVAEAKITELTNIIGRIHLRKMINQLCNEEEKDNPASGCFFKNKGGDFRPIIRFFKKISDDIENLVNRLRTEPTDRITLNK